MVYLLKSTGFNVSCRQPYIDFSLEKGYQIPIFLFLYVENSLEITLPSGSQNHTALFCFHALGEFGPRLAYRSRDHIPRMTRRTTHDISLPTQTNAHKQPRRAETCKAHSALPRSGPHKKLGYARHFVI